MAKVRCPQCQGVVELAEGEAPQCTHCGYGTGHDAPEVAPPEEAIPGIADHPDDDVGHPYGETRLTERQENKITPLAWVGLAVAAVTLVVGIVGALT